MADPVDLDDVTDVPDNDAGSAAAEPSTRPRRGFVAHLLNAILNVAAVGGAICIILVLLALVFDITLILFRTGSMAPAIPQGSLAVVREIPASDVEVGDVVTVNRDDTLPVTHRVTSVEQLPGGDWELTLKGDANEAEDPEPYTVTEVRKVLLSVPGLAKPIAALNSPYALGGITIAVSILVVWALWPRQQRATEPASPPEQDKGARP